MSVLTRSHFMEIDHAPLSGTVSYEPDRFGLGLKVTVGFRFGGWLTLHIALGPLSGDIQVERAL